jgi:hypothetical protein
MSDSARFVSLLEPIVQHLLGEPNRRLSTKEERFGARGSLSIDPEKGTWFDHEANEGGGMLNLVTRETGLVAPSARSGSASLRGLRREAPTARPASE